MRFILTGFSAILLMASCTTTTKFTASRISKANDVPIAKEAHGPNAGNKFMEEVTISSRNSKSATRTQRMEKVLAAAKIQTVNEVSASIPIANVAATNDLQKKYAALLNILPASLSNIALLKTMDDWYGTPYVYGGTSKRGVDCSAFTREIYKDAYGTTLPRTAREQYNTVQKISTTELQEGDLLFFNTTGGVSHVGIYLGNNKFVHSSCKRGVAISDLYETYYISRLVGAGRIEKSNDFLAKNAVNIN